MISMIAALAKQRVIGHNNSMLWHLPADFAWFKHHTMNKPIIMGRRTWQSIGRPLPGRQNIIISRTAPASQPAVNIAVSEKQQCNIGAKNNISITDNILIKNNTPIKNTSIQWADSPQNALELCQHAAEIMIIGGANIYQQFLPQAQRLYLTHIDANMTGDSQFPRWLAQEWHTIFSEAHTADNKNPYNYRFEILQRIVKTK